jgi:hypothetical protein
MKCSQCPASTEVWLDSLALIRFLGQNDRQSFDAIVSHYDNPVAFRWLIHALAHNGVDLTLAFSMATGMTPDDVLDGARDYAVSHGD